MARLLIAVAIGVVVGILAAFLATNALASVANGTPSNASLYQYGNR
jgi:hypothetical protein